MFEGLFEYLIGIIFGFFLLAILLLFLFCTACNFPTERNRITKNRNSHVKDEKEETILWFDSICSNEPIHSAIQKKISKIIQNKISYFSLSPDCQSILKTISVLTTKFPTISSSRVKSFIKDDDKSLVITISINLDSPLIITTSSFVNSLNRDVISDITVTQFNPNVTLVIPYQKGISNVDIDLGVDAEIDVNSAEPIGAGDDVLKGMFIKIMRNLDIKFEGDDDEIFNENDTDNKGTAFGNDEFVEEEEEDDDLDNSESGLRFDASIQTNNRGKVNLVIPPYPSISITAVHPSSDLLLNQNTQPKETEKKENETQTEKETTPLSISKRKGQVSIKPDENILALIEKNKKGKEEKPKKEEKAKLSIAKNRSSCFEVKQKKQNENSLYSEEIFEIVPEEPKIEEEEEQESDNDDDEEAVTSSVKVSKRNFFIE